MSVKGSVTFSRIVGKLTDVSAKAAVTFSNLSATLVLGLFKRVLLLTNNTNANDNDQKNVGKVQADNLSISDTDVKSVSKPLTETP